MAQAEAHVGRTEPQQARSRDKYDRVLDAADRLFCKHGVEGTQMTLLAKEAAVSTSSLYHLFSDRDEIAEALGGRYAARLITAQQPVIVTDLIQLESAIADLVDLNYQLHLDHPGFTALMIHSTMGDSSQSLRSLRDQQVGDFGREIETLVRVNHEELTTVIGHALDVGQQFIVRLVTSARKPEPELLHLKWMLMYYVCGLLRPDCPVIWP